MPEIRMKRDITGPAAERFAACFSKGVIEVEEDENGDLLDSFFVTFTTSNFHF